MHRASHNIKYLTAPFLHFLYTTFTGDADEDEGEGEEEDEDQVDWWARFYETIKDEQRVAEELKKLAKKNKNKEPTAEGNDEVFFIYHDVKRKQLVYLS